jgi:hypothetical protein
MRSAKEQRDIDLDKDASGDEFIQNVRQKRRLGQIQISGFIILTGRLLVKIRKALTVPLLGLSLSHAVVFISLELFGSAPVCVFV